MLALVKNNLLTKKVDLEMRLAKGLPRIRADAGELQQVFLNLINNAAAAMPGGGKLTVITKTNPYNHMVEAVFADTGTGIPKKYRRPDLRAVLYHQESGGGHRPGAGRQLRHRQ